MTLSLSLPSTDIGSYTYSINQPNYNFLSNQGLDLIDRVPEQLWMEVRDIVQEVVIKTITKKKKCKKAKWLSEEGFQISEKRRAATDKGEKERHTI